MIFIEPPQWIDKSTYQFPVLYAHPQLFTPLAQATIRGMKQTVQQILENSRKRNKKRHKSGMQSLKIIVDDSYSRMPESGVDLTPLQIACAQYIGTRGSKYLIIVQVLVAYGANIHSASFFHSLPDTQSLMELKFNEQKYSQKLDLRLKCKRRLAQLENKKYTKNSNPEQRIRDIQLQSTLRQKLNELEIKMQEILQRVSVLKKECQEQKMVNASAYALAIGDRQRTNDTELIEHMVKGAIFIKDSVMEAGTVLTEGIIQKIVEYCIGLNLNLWDI